MFPTMLHDGAEVIQVIRTSLTRRGGGTDGDPMRAVTQYWSLDGELLAEVDPIVEMNVPLASEGGEAVRFLRSVGAELVTLVMLAVPITLAAVILVVAVRP